MKIQNKKRFSVLLFIIFLLVVPFYFRLFPIRTSHYWDETVYLQHSEVMFEGRDNYSELSFRPPLLSAIFYLGYFVWHSVFMAHIIVALLSILGVYYLYLLGSELYNKRIGLIAGLTLAYCPVVVLWSRYTLTGAVALTFSIISTYYFVRGKRYAAILSGLFLGLAVLSRFTSLALTLLFLLMFIFKKVELKYVAKVILVFLISMVPYFIFAHVTTGFFLKPFLSATTVVADHNVPIMFYFTNIHKVLYISSAGLVLYLYSLFKRKGSVKDLALLIFGFAFMLYMTKLPHKELRYLIPVTFPFFLVSAKGFYHGLSLKVKKYWLVFLVIFVLLLLVFVSVDYDFEHRILRYDSEAKVVGEWMSENLDNGVLYTNAEHPILAYYSGFKTLGLYPRDERIYDQLFNNLTQDGYFVYREGEVVYETDIPVHPNKEFLDTDHHFKLIKSFDSYHIYKFTKIDFAWVLQLAEIDEGFYVKELIKRLAFETDDFARADIILILGRLKDDYNTICSASEVFESIPVSGLEERAIVYETIASLGCVDNASDYYSEAAEIWGDIGVGWRAEIDKDLAFGNELNLSYQVEEPVFVNEIPNDFEEVTFGASKIVLGNGDLVVSQAERVSRDWLSAQIRNPFSDDTLRVFSERFNYGEDELREDIGWHEGARIDELKRAGVNHRNAVGTLALKVGTEWYAPDDNGVFRFKISKEKIFYPTTRFLRENLAMMIDTHGVNTIVEQALRYGADAVVACCDLPSKIQASEYLSSKGVDVLCLTDRFVYQTLGRGFEILGSPSIEHRAGAVVLGDRPLTVGRDEVVVVMNGSVYDDAPARYFSLLGFDNVYYVSSGDAGDVVAKAEELRSDFIAVRIFDRSDYYPVEEWLEKDLGNRAILFHSISYPYGYILMNDFPEQVTFGDPNPIFS